MNRTITKEISLIIIMYSYILHWHNPIIFMTLAKNYYGNIIDEVTDLESILHVIGAGTSNKFSILQSYVS